MPYLLLIFILSHLITDYVLQSNRVAALKSQSVRGVFIHICITFVVSCGIHIPFFGLMGVSAALFIATLHFLIDLLKFKVAPKLGRYQLVYFFFDQIMHFFSLYAAAYIFKGSSILTKEPLVINLVLLVCGWILAVPVGTIIAKQLLFDRGVLSFASGDLFFMPHERFSDGVSLTAIYLLGIGGFINGQYILVILGLLNFFFILDQNKKRFNSNQFYALKCFVYAVWSTLSIATTLYFYNFFGTLLT